MENQPKKNIQDIKNNFEFQAKYFEIDDPTHDPQSISQNQGGQKVFAQFQAQISKEDYEQLHQSQEPTKTLDSSDNYLMIFGDKSGSMAGTPFNALKKGCEDLADTIFGDIQEDNSFEKVWVAFYESSVCKDVANNKKDYLNLLSKHRAGGGTDFNPCFNLIQSVIKESKSESKFSIIFLTDGQGSNQQRDELKSFLSQQEKSRGIKSTIFSIGFSKDHDAELLNFLAKSGSEMGNFIYIDTGLPNYGEQMNNALQECLGMAIQSSTKQKMIIQNQPFNYKVQLNIQSQYIFDKNDVDPQNDGLNDQEDQEMQFEEQKEQEIKWSSIKVQCETLIDKNMLANENLRVILHLEKGISIQGYVQIMRIENPPNDMKLDAEIQFINQQTFDLIQQIQNIGNKDDKIAALELLKVIDRSLDSKFEEFMKIKNRENRKKLIQRVQECKSRTTNVLSILRGHNFMGQLSNETIAKLNDHAFKAIKQGGLQKLLDKRALNNETLYQKLDQEIQDISGKTDFKKLESQYQSIVDDIGQCPLSCLNVLESIQEQDCMCIGLSIQRPEAAIADPSRLIINDIYPTYLTANSFLDSAQFKLQNQATDATEVHGGFKSKDNDQIDAQIVMGVGRENITGVLPLFLFKEHWFIAKRKIQPLFGFMCTLDIMGYSKEQFDTIPFLVLIKAINKHQKSPSEVNKRILTQVEETCIQLFITNKFFTQKVVEQIINFCEQPEKVSTRTADVIKSIKILAIQFITILKINNVVSLIENLEHQKYFSDQNVLKDLKLKFVRYSSEEVLRRSTNSEADKLIQDIPSFIYDNHSLFVDDIWEKKSKEIDKLMNQQSENGEDPFKQYEQMALQLKKQFGYEEESIQSTESQQNSQNSKQGILQEQKPIDFNEEIQKLLSQISFASEKGKLLVKTGNEKFLKFGSSFLDLVKILLLDDGHQVKSLSDIPLIKEQKNQFVIILAILIQNAHHFENSNRVQAIQEGNYIDFKDEDVAKQYLSKLLSKNLLNRLMTLESELVKKYQDSQSDETAKLILECPNQFYAAAIMRQNSVYFGRGDFQKMINYLINFKKDYKDVANKLVLLKTGYFYRKGFQLDVNEESENNNGVKLFGIKGGVDFDPENMIKLFSDKNKKNNQIILVNRKYVFRLWAKYVYKTKPEEEKKENEKSKQDEKPTLTLRQLQNIFPEFKQRLYIQNECCDETGRIVKNHDVYKKYQNTPHFTQKNNKNEIQMKMKKIYFDQFKKDKAL